MGCVPYGLWLGSVMTYFKVEQTPTYTVLLWVAAADIDGYFNPIYGIHPQAGRAERELSDEKRGELVFDSIFGDLW